MKNCWLFLMIVCIWLQAVNVNAESGVSSKSANDFGPARPSAIKIKEGKPSSPPLSLEKNGKLTYNLIGHLKKEGSIKNISFSPSGTDILIEYPDYCLLATPSLFWNSLMTKKIPDPDCRWEKGEIIAAGKKDSDNISFFPVQGIVNLGNGRKPSSRMLFLNEKGKKIAENQFADHARKLFIIQKNITHEISLKKESIFEYDFDEVGRRINVDFGNHTVIYDLDSRERYVLANTEGWSILPGDTGFSGTVKQYYLIPGEPYLILKQYYEFDLTERETDHRIRLIDFNGNVLSELHPVPGEENRGVGYYVYVSSYLLVFTTPDYVKVFAKARNGK